MKRKNPNYLRRIVMVKMIDRLFYERGNSRRTHKRGYELFIYPYFGIGADTSRAYRNYPNELLEGVPRSVHLESMLQLDVHVVKNMSLPEAEEFLQMLCRDVEAAFDRIRRRNVPRTAVNLRNYLTEIRRELPSREE